MSEALELSDTGTARVPLPSVAVIVARVRVVRDLVRYGASSAVALALDWTTLTLLVRQGVPAPAAAAIGFSLGMAVTYVASIRLIFADRRHGSRLREAIVFAAVGLAGLGLSEALLLLFSAGFGLSAPLAKAPTAALVFLFNFAVRRTMVFVAPAS